jgi:predicted nucleotidyltransferase/uncharacterized protein with HEPN domain
VTDHDDRVYIALIRDSAREAMETVADMTRDEFLASKAGQAAVAMDVVRIVERVPKLSDTYKTAHPLIDWGNLATLRTRTEPEFAKIDAAVEWEAASTYLPPIADALDALLPARAPWNGTGPEADEPQGAGRPGSAAESTLAASPAPEPPLPIPHHDLRDLCHKLRITRLCLFGSAVRGDFGPDSDIDLLVEYEPGTNHPWGGAGIDTEFSPLFGGREVELIDPEYLNPYVRDGILAEAVEIYPVDRRSSEKVT